MLDRLRALFHRTPAAEPVKPEPPRRVLDGTWRGWMDYNQPRPRGAYGNTPLSADSPYAHDWAQIMRPEWDMPKLLRPRDMHPLMNVAGLYWRPLDDRVMVDAGTGTVTLTIGAAP